MTTDTVIRASGLGKRYVIGHQAERESYVALRDVIARNVRNVGRSAVDLVRGRPNIAGDEVEDFWALRDVSFEIRRGEVVGVIGRNGAGKSTLLKILSRITEPTEGRVEIRGRVASLLEVGTGFHPELTGRENIYLNGAILGMTNAEIRRKFDEIVAFAEVERFLDTPVKRYSSGMYVRLAFAVAAHLEPEILVVDEVLSVGDAEFQKKCLGKMGEVASRGRTVLFVSHNMAAVASLTSRTLLFNTGSLLANATTQDAIAQYILSSTSKGASYEAPTTARPSITSVTISTSHANSLHTSGSPFKIRVVVHLPWPIANPCLSILIHNIYNTPAVHLKSYDQTVISSVSGYLLFEFDIPRLGLNVGDYTLTLFLSDPPGGERYEALENVCAFTVDIIDRSTLFGWHPEDCVYLADFSCRAQPLDSSATMAAQRGLWR